MEDAPRTTDRWLLILAVALIAEAGTAYASGLKTPPGCALAIVAAALGAVTLLTSRRPETDPSSWTIARFAALSLVAILLINSYIYLSPGNFVRRAPLTLLSLPAGMFMGLGGALLWSAALALRDHPRHPGLAKIGRIGAGVAQLGFIFAFMPEVSLLGRTFGSMPTTYPLLSLARLVVRVLLLWASVEMMRAPLEPDLLRVRFVKVNRLMMAWASVMVVQSLVIFGTTPGERYPGPFHLFMRNFIYQTAIVAATLLVARRFRVVPEEGAAPA